MIVDQFLAHKYHKDTYNCLHFSRDVWLVLMNEDIADRLAGLLGQASDRRVKIAHFRSFKLLDKLESPCLMYMTQLGKDPHVGVVIDNQLLHIRKTGPEFLPIPLATRGATPPFRYYK